MALNTNVMNSRTLYDCCRCLNEAANRYVVHITWVPGHGHIPGNCKANELARRGTTLMSSLHYGSLWVTVSNAIVDLVNSRCAAWGTDRMAQKILPKLDKRHAVALQRIKLSTVIRVVTGLCMRGMLVLDILQMISAEAVEIRRRMRLFFT